MTRIIDKLHVIALTPMMHDRTCGYWFTVTQNNTPHTAFASREALDRWMRERGLSLQNELQGHGYHGMSPIIGEYRIEILNNAGKFDETIGDDTRTLFNGNYTAAKLRKDPDGIVTVCSLCPSVARPDFDYTESRAMMCGVAGEELDSLAASWREARDIAKQAADEIERDWGDIYFGQGYLPIVGVVTATTDQHIVMRLNDGTDWIRFGVVEKRRLDQCPEVGSKISLESIYDNNASVKIISHDTKPGTRPK